MSLLGDFLAGVSGSVPSVFTDVQRREDEDRRQQRLMAEREEQRRAIAEERALTRADRNRDVTDEQSRRDMLDQRVAAQIAAGRNGITPEQAVAAGRGGLLQATVEGQIDGTGVGPGAPVRAIDEVKSKKVFRDFNTALGMKQSGSTGKDIMATLNAEDEDAKFEALSPEGKAAYSQDKLLRKGYDPEAAALKRELGDARIAALEAQARQRDSAASKNDRWVPGSGGGGGRGTDAEERRAAALVKIYENRAIKARDAANKAVGKTARAAAEAAADRAEALAEEVIRTGKEPSGAATAPTSAKPAAKSPYPDGTKLRGKDGKTYIVRDGKPVPV